MDSLDDGRFIDMVEVYDKKKFYEWLMEYEVIAFNTIKNQYIVIPVEYILKSYHLH